MFSKVEKAVLKAGEHLLKGFDSIKEVSYKGKIDLVTQFDVEVEKILLEELSFMSGEYGFVAEETATEKTTKDKAVYIDPIDGTTNFVHGFPFCCISLGVYEYGEGAYGIVYNPVMNELYTAEKGCGAFLNGERIVCSKKDILEECLIATGFPYSVIKEKPEEIMAVLQRVLCSTRGIRRAGSAALDLCYTAKGVFDGYYEFNLSPWDIAAGVIVASEAGLTVQGRDKNKPADLYERFVMSANSSICEDLYSLIFQK